MKEVSLMVQICSIKDLHEEAETQGSVMIVSLMKTFQVVHEQELQQKQKLQQKIWI